MLATNLGAVVFSGCGAALMTADHYRGVFLIGNKAHIVGALATIAAAERSPN
jgi:hypothetical protein